jgi:hypothetical protein
MKHIYVFGVRRGPERGDVELERIQEMTAISGYPDSQRPRQAVPGQLPRVNRADGSSIWDLLVGGDRALTETTVKHQPEDVRHH